MSALHIHLLRWKYYLQSLGRDTSQTVFVNSIPKTGTNLVVSLARAYGRVPISGPFINPLGTRATFQDCRGLIFGHVERLEGTLDTLGFDAGYLLVRDPASYVMSLARYMSTNTRHPAHGFAAQQGSLAGLCEKVAAGFQSGPFTLKPVDQRYQDYMGTAQSAGLQLVDFDVLRTDPSRSPAADALMRYIGGPQYKDDFKTRLAQSKRTSTTFRHSRRATPLGALPEAVRGQAAFQRAQEIYDRSLLCDA